jgi:hypothetical protein
MKKFIALALFVCAGYAAQAQAQKKATPERTGNTVAGDHTGHVAGMPKQPAPAASVPFPKIQPAAPAKQAPAPAKWKKN